VNLPGVFGSLSRLGLIVTSLSPLRFLIGLECNMFILSKWNRNSFYLFLQAFLFVAQDTGYNYCWAGCSTNSIILAASASFCTAWSPCGRVIRAAFFSASSSSSAVSSSSGSDSYAESIRCLYRRWIRPGSFVIAALVFSPATGAEAWLVGTGIGVSLRSQSSALSVSGTVMVALYYQYLDTISIWVG
jgi:hypothetical protein